MATKLRDLERERIERNHQICESLVVIGGLIFFTVTTILGVIA